MTAGNEQPYNITFAKRRGLFDVGMTGTGSPHQHGSFIYQLPETHAPSSYTGGFWTNITADDCGYWGRTLRGLRRGAFFGDGGLSSLMAVSE